MQGNSEGIVGGTWAADKMSSSCWAIDGPTGGTGMGMCRGSTSAGVARSRKIDRRRRRESVLSEIDAVREGLAGGW